MTAPNPTPPEAGRARYEVESELNPRYLETGDMNNDYYGVYHVVRWQGDMRLEVVETFSAEFEDGRFKAYALARRLNTTPPTAGEDADTQGDV